MYMYMYSSYHSKFEWPVYQVEFSTYPSMYMYMVLVYACTHMHTHSMVVYKLYVIFQENVPVERFVFETKKGNARDFRSVMQSTCVHSLASYPAVICQVC